MYKQNPSTSEFPLSQNTNKVEIGQKRLTACEVSRPLYGGNWIAEVETQQKYSETLAEMIEKKREEVLAKLSKNCEKTMYDPFVYGDWNKLTMESKKSIESKLNTFKWLYGVNTKEPTDKPVIPVQHIDTMKELLITVIDNTLSTKEKETAESMIKVLEDYVNGLSR